MKTSIFSYSIISVLLLISSSIKAQVAKETFPSYFGFQFKPIIPANFLGNVENKLINENFTTNISQKYGYSFGASVRISISKSINIETGMNLINRNFNVNFSYPDSALETSLSLALMNYDVPLNILVYIRLSDQIYMNGSIGGSLVFNPFDVAAQNYVGSKHLFIVEGRRRGRVGFEINANFGFDWRTEKSGIFYLGITGRVPTAPIYNIATVYQYDSFKDVVIGSINGTYISLDLRYFFPNIKSKGPQFVKGPIEY
jgi:hypothetical protein